MGFHREGRTALLVKVIFHLELESRMDRMPARIPRPFMFFKPSFLFQIPTIYLAGILFAGFLLPRAGAQEKNEKSTLVIPPGQARPLASPAPGEKTPAPKERIASFFSLLAKDRVEDAYNDLVRGSIIEERKEDVETLKDRTQRALDSYGMIRRFEILEERTAGTSLIRFTCLSLNEDLPLRWRFYFYDSAKGWKLVDLRVDDGLVELFDEVARPARQPNAPQTP